MHTLFADPTAGRVFVGGHFSSVDGLSGPWLASVGAKRGSVFKWASAPLGQVWSLALSPQGPLYAAVGGHQGGQLDSYHPLTGGLRWHRFADGDMQAVSIAGSTILAGGHFLNVCTTNQGGGSPWVCTAPLRRNRFFATDQNGAIQSWNPDGNALYGVWALRNDATHIVAGGDFTIIDGQHQAHYAEIPPLKDTAEVAHSNVVHTLRVPRAGSVASPRQERVQRRSTDLGQSWTLFTPAYGCGSPRVTALFSPPRYRLFGERALPWLRGVRSAFKVGFGYDDV